LRDHLGDDLGSYWYMVAGPPGMTEAIGETLGKAGIPEKQVHVGSFSGY
jgi:hypothetical protein